MLPQHPQQHLLERMDALFMERMQRPLYEDAPTEVLLDVLAQREVLVDDFLVEGGHARVGLGRRVRRVEPVDVVLLPGGCGGERNAAHQVHEPRAGVGTEVAYREDVCRRAACEAGLVES